MSPENTSTRPPSIDNPVGDRILITSCISFALVVLFVVLRLLGRWRQRQRSPTLGESHHYVGWSDLTIVVALVSFNVRSFEMSRCVLRTVRVARQPELPVDATQLWINASQGKSQFALTFLVLA